jgi:hypothetical protein
MSRKLGNNLILNTLQGFKMAGNPANALNISGNGIVTSDLGVISTSEVTQYGVLVAGENQTVVSISPGTTGQVLVSNGSANPSFQTISSLGFTSINIQTFTASGTYTPTAGMSYCIIEAQGAGGGGGSCASNSANTISLGSGGGSGEYRRGFYNASSIGTSQSITVGAAGAAGTSGGNGGIGGDTLVGNLITCKGGNGGTGGPSRNSDALILGGNGGNGGSGGDFSIPGCKGLYTFYFGTSIQPLGCSGQGGTSMFGIGGGAVEGNAVGNPGHTGGGGGGASGSQGGGGTGGGAGGAGIVVITEYIT